jgi:aminoglycoside 6-adenylyltransferase
MENEEADVLDRLVRWADQHPLVRALVLESSRANDQATLDAFSDYDVLVVVADICQFAKGDAWLRDVGAPMVTFRDRKLVQGVETYMRLVLYEDGTKIDYAVWPVALLRQAVERQELPDLLDWGYRILIDKDVLAVRLPAPTRRAYIPTRPSEPEYRAQVEEFWWETTYAAKNLWRDDLIHARYNLDVVIRNDLLRRMLEWRVECDHGWAWNPGPVGRGLKRHLPSELWSELEATFVGPDIEDNWGALFATTALFRRVAIEVGQRLGYAYPEAIDSSVTTYLRAVRNHPH